MQHLPLLVFLNKWFKFQSNFCNRYHNLLIIMNLTDITILDIKSADYRVLLALLAKARP